MKVLLDNDKSEQLVLSVEGHGVWTAKQMLWDEFSNGDLLRVAEDAGFDVRLTADQNLWYQQNNAKRRIALVVVNTNRLTILAFHIKRIVAAISRAKVSSYEFIELVPSYRRRPRRG